MACSSRTLEEIENDTKDIRKILRPTTLERFCRDVKEGKIQIAPFNRKEVEKRSGSAEELFYSLSMGFSVGIGVAYWNGVPTVTLKPSGEEDVNITPSPENPIYITDMGHRTRWIISIVNDEVTINEVKLSELREASPMLYNRVMKKPIIYEITCSTKGEVQDWYVKEEYAVINRTSCSMTNGELLRSATEEEYKILLTKLIEAVSTTRIVDDTRDKQNEWAAALVNGMLAGDSDKINTKMDDVMNHPPLTPEAVAYTQRVIEAIANQESTLARLLKETQIQAENELKAAKTTKSVERIASAKAFVKSVKEWTKRFHDRKLDIALDGPLVHSFLDRPIDSSEEDHFSNVSVVWTNFYKKIWMDSVAWKSGIDSLKNHGPNNKAKSFNKRRYAHNWSAVKNVATPRRSDLVGAGAGDGNIALPAIEA